MWDAVEAKLRAAGYDPTTTHTGAMEVQVGGLLVWTGTDDESWDYATVSTLASGGWEPLPDALEIEVGDGTPEQTAAGVLAALQTLPTTRGVMDR